VDDRRIHGVALARRLTAPKATATDPIEAATPAGQLELAVPVGR
jgi:hypothetical protein